MYRKKGTTLVELVLYLSLLGVISLIFFTGNNFKKQKEEISIDEELLEIKSFIVKNKMDAQNEKVPKNLIVRDNYISLEGNKKNRLDFVNISNTSDLVININSNGKVVNSFTLLLKDKDKNTYKVRSYWRSGVVYIEK
ncbi:hypothetical protein [Clostridium mediterraneense]|uniref:hypothetical protein n=1 Tax=Clostridium mediterraneense TaxID=1805472 RepID=UPI00082AF1F7|nr:hypothetical protein [Clostridium mediterraneense]